MWKVEIEPEEHLNKWAVRVTDGESVPWRWFDDNPFPEQILRDHAVLAANQVAAHLNAGGTMEEWRHPK